MASIDDLKEQYLSLDQEIPFLGEEAIKHQSLLGFDYAYLGQETDVLITADEFTAVCPWNGLPDCGTLAIRYTPKATCIELKSLKYYLLSYRNVGIVQEHAANRILRELVTVCLPEKMTVTLDYKSRGGLQTTVSATYDESDRLT